MGKRVDFEDLASEDILEAPVSSILTSPTSPTQSLLSRVAVNPVNPRDEPGDLTSLASSLKQMGQMQNLVVVSRGAFLAIHPEHEETIGANADFVVVGGSRRKLAAELAGFTMVDITVKDHLARDQKTFFIAAISENLEREGLNPIEEAKAVERIVALSKNYDEAAAVLSRSKGWITQRITLLKLSDGMRVLLLSGELKIKDARELGKVEPELQMTKYQELLESRTEKAAAEQKLPAEQTAAAGQEVPPQSTPAPAGTTEPPAPPQDHSKGAEQAAPSTPSPVNPTVPSQAKPPAAEPSQVDTTPADASVEGPEKSDVRAAVQVLGGTPEAIAAALQQTLSAEEVGRLSQLLALAA